MADTTPVHKHPTEELPALELINYRLKESEKNHKDHRAEMANFMGEIREGLEGIRLKMATGESRMGNHSDAIDSIQAELKESKRDTKGLIAGLGGIAAAIGSFLYAFFGGK